jgi:uncharacterized protein (TIGR02118 family)
MTPPCAATGSGDGADPPAAGGARGAGAGGEQPEAAVVKAVARFKRRPGMAVEEFQAYWRTRHPEVVTRLAGVRRYVQSHTRLSAYRTGEPPYDGIAELWFDDTAAIHALRGTPALAAVQADEARFIDRATMGLVIATDHVVVDGPVPAGAAKGIGFVRRKPGMAPEAFQRHWRDVHGPLGAALPGLRRYVQSHTRLAAYAGGREPAWDGLALSWLDDSAAWRTATASPEWERAKADDPNFIAAGPIPFIMAVEHVIAS